MPNEQNHAAEALPRSGRGAALSRRLLVLTGLALLVTAGLIGTYVVLRPLAADGKACEAPPDEPGPISDDPLHRPKLFVGWEKPGWEKPDLALIVSGQMHGYMFPCGCSEPQQGGLVRRMTFINELKAKGWDVLGVDLGELPPNLGDGIPRQRGLKLEYTMKALDLLGYKAVGLGKTEMGMPLIDALSQYSVNNPLPRPLNATLDITHPAYKVYHDSLNVRPFAVLPGTPRIGVASLVGPDLEDYFKKNKASMKFLNNKTQVLPKLYKAFIDEHVDVAMLLHHEYPNNPANGQPAGFLATDLRRREMAVAIAKEWEKARKKDARIPPLQLLMVLTEEPEPPGTLQAVDGTPTCIVDIGHKGKYVGVVGFKRQAGTLQLKYELVKMEPKYEPLPGQSNKVLDVLEEYAKQVKNENLLKQADFMRSPHPIQVDPYVKKTYGGSTFVGTARCLNCHGAAGKVWAKSKHKIAFQTLVKKTSPSLRQYDPECVVCHTVGFKHLEGYNDLPRDRMRELVKENAGGARIQAEIALRNREFEHVGCENCHGPGSAHANGNPDDAKLYPLINPFRASKNERKFVDQMDNDPSVQVRAQAAQEAKRLFDRRMQRLDGDFCQKCHDLENDVNWTQVPFLQKWMQIMHNDRDNVGNRWLPARQPVVVPAGRKKD